jgi:two-component system sensor histidine kinase YesM
MNGIITVLGDGGGILKKDKRPLLQKIRLLSDISIERKLVLLYIFVIAIPFISFGIFIINDSERANINQLLKDSQSELQKAVAGINKNVEVFQRTTQIVMSNKDLMNTISKTEELSSEEIISFNNGPLTDIQRIQYTNPDIYRLRLFVKDLRMQEVFPVLYYENRIEDKYWINNFKNTDMKFYWQLNHLDDNVITNVRPVYKDVVSLYRLIQYLGNDHLGVIEINMLSEDFFPEIYDENYQKEDTFTCLIQGKNIEINSKNKLVKSLRANNVDLLNSLTSNTISESDHISFELNGERVLVVSSYIESIDATIYKVTSLTKAINRGTSMRIMTIVAVIVSILLLSILTSAITSIVFKKMRIIIDSMRKVEQGEFDVDITVRGNDEFGELAHHFRKMLKKINELIYMIVRKESATKDAEIRALQTQVNAHFIYNVLENIKMMALIEHHYEVSNALTSLGRLIRYSINWTKQYVHLRDELENIKNYLVLINIRYDQQIELKINVPQEYLNQEVLKMILQPVVENSVNHGLNEADGGRNIEIKALRMESRLIIDIIDNGVGMDQENLEKLRSSICADNVDSEKTAYKSSGKGNGIGLKNVNERIKLFYGSDYGMEIYSEKDKGTVVRISIPYTQYR